MCHKKNQLRARGKPSTMVSAGRTRREGSQHVTWNSMSGSSQVQVSASPIANPDPSTCSDTSQCLGPSQTPCLGRVTSACPSPRPGLSKEDVHGHKIDILKLIQGAFSGSWEHHKRIRNEKKHGLECLDVSIGPICGRKVDFS